jgi:hypothetical protein
MGATLQQVAEYKLYAADCRRIAQDTIDLDNRRRLMEMATAWTLLAHERQAKLLGRKFISINEH